MGLLTPLAVRIGAISWMPNLALTVPGRKSGIPRTTPLLCVPHDGGWLWPNFAKYEERTDRRIPVFYLEPLGG